MVTRNYSLVSGKYSTLDHRYVNRGNKAHTLVGDDLYLGSIVAIVYALFLYDLGGTVHVL